MPERDAQIARFKELTEVLLPGRAQEERWPIRLDHCFKRVCLDHAFQDVWYKHLKKPAEKNIDGTPLQGAIACAEEMLIGGLPVVKQRNQASLGYRGKRRTSFGKLQ